MAGPSRAVALEERFAAALERLGPFEPAPLLAIGVSGGPDSLALTLLADEWARARGGKVVGLTVDHRLREGSGAEAAQVGAWLATRGIEHRTLIREGPTPTRNIQEAARQARYRLIEAWCRAHHCLHVLLAHHCEDQAETLILRLGRGSGVDGLAGIPEINELGACRILRPLLGVRRAELAAYLEARGQASIADPSNASPRFTRVRVRAALDEAGAGPSRLSLTAANLGRARTALELAADTLLARTTHLHEAGFATLDPKAFARAPEELRLRVLAGLLTAIGGGAHRPRLERLQRLAASLGTARTLAGCRILPWRGRVLICREPASVAAPVPIEPGATVEWDGRFQAAASPAAPAGLRLGAAGRGVPGELPGVVREALPALFDLEGVALVPHLRFSRAGSETWLATLVWKPNRGLTKAGFTVA